MSPDPDILGLPSSTISGIMSDGLDDSFLCVTRALEVPLEDEIRIGGMHSLPVHPEVARSPGT